MQIEIKINGEAAELQDVLRALLNSSTEQTTEANSIDLRKPAKSRKAGEVIKVEAPATDANSVEQVKEVAALQEAEKPAAEATKEQPDAPATEAQTAISFEEFRKAVGAAALKNKDAVKAIIVDKYKAPKTAEVEPKDYAAIIEELKAL